MEQENTEKTSLKGNESTNSFVPMSAEEEKKKARKKKGDLIAAAVGDGFSSLANLFFASKGAAINTAGKAGTAPNSRMQLMTDRIRGKHQEEDTRYSKALTLWQREEEKKRLKAQKELEKAQKESAANERVLINGDFGFLKSNWQSKDFIDEAFQHLLDSNTDARLNEIIEHHRFLYEPNWVKVGTTWSHDHDDKNRIDLFKEKGAGYLKRAMIESFLGGADYTSDENRANLIQELSEFEKKWIPLK